MYTEEELLLILKGMIIMEGLCDDDGNTSEYNYIIGLYLIVILV